jgi:hypothetical protein
VLLDREGEGGKMEGMVAEAATDLRRESSNDCRAEIERGRERVKFWSEQHAES